MVFHEVFQGGHEVGDVVEPSGRTLIKYCGRDRWKRHSWLWRCSCGAEFGPNAVCDFARSVSCRSCMGARLRRENGKGYREIAGTFLGKVRGAAERRGLAWNIDGEYLWSVWEDQGGLCAYSGWSLTHGNGASENRGTASIDRIDPSRGYVRDNVQWVHRDVNFMKWRHGEARFLQLCQAIAQHRQGDVDAVIDSSTYTPGPSAPL